MNPLSTRGILLLATLAGALGASTCAPFPAPGTATGAAACFGNDLLAGSANRDDHRRWAEGQVPGTLEATLQTRINQLWLCVPLTDDQRSTGFADISTVIAR